MKPTHTPGPWNVDQSGAGLEIRPYRSIHAVTILKHGDEANARLIAAAPEMLSTLEAIQVRCACREFTTLDRDAQQLILYIIEQTSVAIRTAKEGA